MRDLRLVGIIFLCLCSLPAWGQSTYAVGLTDTLDVRFKLDSTRVDADYDGNRERFQSFADAFRLHYAHRPKYTVQLDIFAGASPEGTAAHNRMLGQKRANSIKLYLEDSLRLKVGRVNLHNLAARWDDFYDAVYESDEPWRQEVLDIIRMAPSEDEHAWDHRELKLRALHGGSVWPVLLEKYLSPLRSGGSAILHYYPERDTLFIAYGPAVRDTVFIKDTTVVVHDYPLPVPRVKQREKADQSPVWAIKTNLLLVGVLAPNVEVEIPLGTRNRWSLEGEIIFPWWTFSRNAYAEQVLNLGVEARYWLGKREYHPCLDGWHIGLAAAFGYYDLEWKSRGVQGEYVNGYLNFGYQHRWGKGKRWGVDASLGVGALFTPRHRNYLGSTLFPETHTEPYDDHLMYQDKGSLLWPGASHINVSLMYFLDWKRRDKK